MNKSQLIENTDIQTVPKRVRTKKLCAECQLIKPLEGGFYKAGVRCDGDACGMI